MTEVPSNHPGDEALHALSLGQLTEAELARVSAHLAACPECCRRIDQLAADDPLLARLKQSAESPQAAIVSPAQRLSAVRAWRQRQEARLPRPKLNPQAVPVSLPAPRQIGDYDILAEVGRGGMGVVYKARHRGLHRLVALKMVLAGEFAAPLQELRFRLEAELAARVQHPHIVQVYEIGNYEGRPFLALEWVEGGSLADRLDGKPWPPRKAATLIETLARAIDVAHGEGVVHRDLKPANILLAVGQPLPPDPVGVGLESLTFVPKITDFGLAQTMEGGRTLTQSGFLVGTPGYMSPEQAGGKRALVGPATDVYALGVVLYQLLTGQLPFADGSTLEQLRAVMSDEPPRPRRLQPGVPRDLEAITLHCLEKEPRRRYPSALALAQDLQRFREGKVVTARPTSALYQLRKFARRHRGLVGGVLATGTALVVGTVFSLLFALGETRQRHEADRERSAALANEEKARAEAQRARQSEAQTQAVLEFVENKVFAAARPEGYSGGLGYDISLRKAIVTALPYVSESFKDQPLIEARLRQTLGNSFAYLGEARRAVEQFELARQLYTAQLGPDHPDTLRSMNKLATSYAALGRYADALKLHEQTLALRKATLGPDHPDTLMGMHTLANSYGTLGRYAEALKLREETLARRKAQLGPDHSDTLMSMNNLASSYEILGRYADAVKLHEETLARRRAQLGSDHPDTLMSMYNLAYCDYMLGRYADALKLHEQTLALRKAKLGPDHPETLWTMWGLADTYAALGRHAEALKLHEETLELRKAKRGPDHPDTLLSMNSLANCYAALGRHADALKLFEETLALRKAKLGPDHPDTLKSMYNLANCYAALGRHADALKLHEQTLTLRKAKLGPDHPHTILSMNDLAWCLATIPNEKLRDPARAVELAGRAAEARPDDPSVRGTLGTARYRAGQWKGAIEDLAKALEGRKPDDPNNAKEGFVIAMAHCQLGEKDKAREWFDRAAAWVAQQQTPGDELRRFRTEAATLLGVQNK